MAASRPLAGQTPRRTAQQDSAGWCAGPLIGHRRWRSSALLIVVPVVNVFYEALAKGLGAYWNNLVGDPDTLRAIRLTLTVAPVAVALNTVFGLAAAWAIARFRFRGRALLTRSSTCRSPSRRWWPV